MTRTGVFAEDERFELIGGEIVPMNAKGIKHELMKNALMYFWVDNTPREFRMATETMFRMSEDTFAEPDIVFYRRVDGLERLDPRTVLLAVEIADSSLSFDLGHKARLYSAFHVPEVWVINAVRRTCHVHSRPGPNGYEQIRVKKSTEPLALPFAPHVTIALAHLDIA